MTEEDVLMFWKRFREVYSPSKDQVWNAVLRGLQKYLLILKGGRNVIKLNNSHNFHVHFYFVDRNQLNDEIIALRKQNLELKHLLSSYIEEHETHAPCNKPNQAIPKIEVELN